MRCVLRLRALPRSFRLRLLVGAASLVATATPLAAQEVMTAQEQAAVNALGQRLLLEQRGALAASASLQIGTRPPVSWPTLRGSMTRGSDALDVALAAPGQPRGGGRITFGLPTGPNRGPLRTGALPLLSGAMFQQLQRDPRQAARIQAQAQTALVVLLDQGGGTPLTLMPTGGQLQVQPVSATEYRVTGQVVVAPVAVGGPAAPATGGRMTLTLDVRLTPPTGRFPF